MKRLQGLLLLVWLAPLGRAQNYAYEQPMVAGGGVMRASQLWVDPFGQNDSDLDSICWENFEFPVDATLAKLRWWGEAPPPLGFTISFFNQDPNTVAVQPHIFGAGSEPISEHDYTSYSSVFVGNGMYQYELDLVAPLAFAANTRYFVSVVALVAQPSVTWKWAQSAVGTYGTFWWQRGAHMYFHTGEERALSLATAAGWPTGTSYCSGDGSDVPCPCSNDGVSGAGCLNSSGAGTILSAFGNANVNADTVVLSARQCPPSTPGLFFSGPSALAGQTFGDGLRCVSGGVVRLGVVTSSPTGLAESPSSLSLREGLSGGEARRYQYWYRDVSGPCGQGFNTSNAVMIQW